MYYFILACDGRFDASTGLDKASLAVTAAAFKVNHNASSSPNLQSAISRMRTMSRDHVAEIMQDRDNRSSVVSALDDASKKSAVVAAVELATVSSETLAAENQMSSPNTDEEVNDHHSYKRSRRGF
jgi:hypothetical protein